jgi:hypothetical protein
MREPLFGFPWVSLPAVVSPVLAPTVTSGWVHKVPE